MPDSDDLPDYRTPSPDEGHEAIRAPLAQAIDDLATNTAGVDDSYFLTDLLFSLLDGALAAIDDLAARLDALTPPAP